jgi:peptide deformylase
MPIEELLRMGFVRPIVRWGEPVMHTPTRKVTDFGSSLQILLADMFATNLAADGAGLAATQIGVDLAIFVFDCLDGERRERIGLVCNPTVTFAERSARRFEEVEEGCLSLPGAFYPTRRPDYVTCRGQDQFGNDITVVGTGTLARCLQHETDHTNGLIFADHLSDEARNDLYVQHENVAYEYPDDWPVSPSME